jgi:hypothetical protein
VVMVSSQTVGVGEETFFMLADQEMKMTESTKPTEKKKSTHQWIVLHSGYAENVPRVGPDKKPEMDRYGRPVYSQISKEAGIPYLFGNDHAERMLERGYASRARAKDFDDGVVPPAVPQD